MDIAKGSRLGLRFRRSLLAATSILAAGGSCLGWYLVQGESQAKPRSLEAIEPIVRLSSPTDDSQEAIGVFRLVNRGRQPVVIRDVSTSCSCVQVGDSVGITMAPGAAHDLTFKVEVPEYGTKSTNINVYHDNVRQAVELRLEVTGRHEPPVLVRVANSSPTFHGLRSINQTAEVVVVAHEAIGSEPWIRGITCDLDQVTVNPGKVTEESNPDTSIVERNYKFVIAWDSLPSSPSFSGNLFLGSTSDIDGPVNIGRLTGSLATQRLFSPSSVVLSAGGRLRETILFEPHTGTWSLPDGVSPPDWLSIDWEGEGGDRRLVLTSNEADQGEDLSASLPLVSDQGLRGNLEISLMRPRPLKP